MHPWCYTYWPLWSPARHRLSSPIPWLTEREMMSGLKTMTWALTSKQLTRWAIRTGLCAWQLLHSLTYRKVIVYILYSDECEPDPCKNNGTCVDGINSYTCQCHVGYTGNTCDTYDICLTGPCSGVAVCESFLDGTSYGCSCPSTHQVNCQIGMYSSIICLYLWLRKWNTFSKLLSASKYINKWKLIILSTKVPITGE